MTVNDGIARLTRPVDSNDHSQGSPDAVVTLVEYGDYECPHCGRAHPIVKEIQRRLGSQLQFVFRNFPLSEIHPHAQHAAEAAEAAGAQHKFWEMHDTIFEHQRALSDQQLVRYAVDLGADEGQFTRDFMSHVYQGRVREDFLSGIRSGVNGTPTFFINNIRYDSSWDADTLEQALRAAIHLD